MSTKNATALSQNKDIISVVLGTGLILMIPLMVMQFSSAMNWSWFDFAVVGTLLLGTGFIYVLLTRIITNTTHRIFIGLGLLAFVILAWIELAVGIFGTPLAGS